MKTLRWIVLMCIIVTIGYCTQVAYATPPPPEYRAAYLLPNPVSPYYNQSDDLGFVVIPSQNGERASSLFPALSKYRASRNFTDTKTGDTYISEIWYFDNGSSFSASREQLNGYLQKHGKVSPVMLDISGDLARTGDPYIAGLHATRINATAYEAADTSGYFIIFSTNFFPGENYYIAYYGVIGSDLKTGTPMLKMLIMSCFPGFVEGRAYAYNPVSPTNPATFLPVTLTIFSLGCIGAFSVLRKKRDT